MVRIRKQNGDAATVPDCEALEILDQSDGSLGVLIITDRKKTVRVLIPGDPLFTGYCKTHGMQPATVHKHEPE